MQDAKKSQFLEGDIRRSQQFFDIERQSLDLQGRSIALNQEMLDFNKRMLPWITGIQITQAAIGLTRAGLSLAQTIQSIHDQKSTLDVQSGTTQYKAGVNQAVTDGYSPYAETPADQGSALSSADGESTSSGEGGSASSGGGGASSTKLTYIGYDGYELPDGRTLGQLKQEIIEGVGRNYWTRSSAERGMQIASNAFENIELAAMMDANAVMSKERQDKWEQIFSNAVNNSRLTGDFTQLHAVIDSTEWMSADKKSEWRMKGERMARAGNVKDEAMRITTQRGYAEGVLYATEAWNQGLITGDDLDTIKSKLASEARSSLQVTNEEIQRRITQNEESGMTILESRNDLIQRAAAQQDPQARAAWEKAANDQQLIAVNKRFNEDWNKATSDMSLEEIKFMRDLYKDDGGYSPDYSEQKGAQAEHRAEFDKLISRLESINNRGGTEERITEAAVRGKLKELLSDIMAGRGGEFGSIQDFNKKFKSVLYQWAYEAGYGGSQKQFEDKYTHVMEQYWTFAKEAVKESPEALSAISSVENYVKTLNGSNPEKALYMGKAYAGVTAHALGQLTSGLYDKIYEYDNRDPKRSGEAFSESVKGMLGVITGETVQALQQTGRSGDRALIDVVEALDNNDIMHLDYAGRRVIMPGPVDDQSMVQRGVENAWGVLGSRIAEREGLDPERLVAHPRKSADGYEEDASPEFQYDGGDKWYRFTIQGEGRNKQLVLEHRQGLNGEWSDRKVVDRAAEDRAAAGAFRQHEREHNAWVESNNREAGTLANRNDLPMPSEYKGRADDTMQRQEFINKYGVEKYMQFLTGWYGQRGMPLPEGIR